MEILDLNSDENNGNSEKDINKRDNKNTKGMVIL